MACVYEVSLQFVKYCRVYYGVRQNVSQNVRLDTTGEKEKRTSEKNVDGRSTSSHDNKKFRTRSMEKQRGMGFGLWKRATAFKKHRIER
jgi:hypothetical protein